MIGLAVLACSLFLFRYGFEREVNLRVRLEGKLEQARPVLWVLMLMVHCLCSFLFRWFFCSSCSC